jgi:hypothetical protein
MDGSLPSFEERMADILATRELENQIVELAGHLNAANYRFLSLLAEYDRRKGWNDRATAYRRAEEQELSRERQQQLHREVRYYWDYDGSLVLKARLPADVGALVLKALEAAVPETPSPTRPDPRTNPDGFIPPDSIEHPSLSNKRAAGGDLRELPGARRRSDERRRAASSRAPRFS